MADRNRGEKSTVRIARSSWEQNGYERHRTLPVPVSSGGTLTASRSPHGDAEKFGIPEKVSRGPRKNFDRGIGTVNRIIAGLFPGAAARPPSSFSLSLSHAPILGLDPLS